MFSHLVHIHLIRVLHVEAFCFVASTSNEQESAIQKRVMSFREGSGQNSFRSTTVKTRIRLLAGMSITNTYQQCLICDTQREK